jgi:hypothetical protein
MTYHDGRIGTRQVFPSCATMVVSALLLLALSAPLPIRAQNNAARRLWTFLFCLCLMATTATMSSCGGGAGADPPGTAAGTYPLTVTATFKSSSGGTFTDKVSFNLVVQ